LPKDRARLSREYRPAAAARGLSAAGSPPVVSSGAGAAGTVTFLTALARRADRRVRLDGLAGYGASGSRPARSIASICLDCSTARSVSQCQQAGVDRASVPATALSATSTDGDGAPGVAGNSVTSAPHQCHRQIDAGCGLQITPAVSMTTSLKRACPALMLMAAVAAASAAWRCRARR
jgi:hypothetical protein